MPSRSRLEDKFRATGLELQDGEPLLQCIREETNQVRLAGLLYMWGYTFPEQPEIMALCLRYIEHPSPGLTATCLRLVCDYWGHWQDHEQALARYLDPEIFDEWYDEVIVAYSYVSRHPYDWSQETLTRYANVEREAERLDLPHFD